MVYHPLMRSPSFLLLLFYFFLSMELIVERVFKALITHNRAFTHINYLKIPMLVGTAYKVSEVHQSVWDSSCQCEV